MTHIRPNIQRRQFLRHAALATARGVAALPALHRPALLAANGRAQRRRGKGGYGPLQPAADLRDGVSASRCRKASLPHVQPRRRADVGRQPRAARARRHGRVQHAGRQVPPGAQSRGPQRPGAGTTAIDANAYDAKGGGGTTTLVVNPFTRELERDFVSLSGTIVNCAGGVTPWDSWITCEETNAGHAGGWLKQHGYCFDVPAGAERHVPAVAADRHGPVLARSDRGRPAHLDRLRDRGQRRQQRLLPLHREHAGRSADGGTLQMLAIEGRFQYDTRTNQTIGVAAAGRPGCDIANPEPGRHLLDGCVQSGPHARRRALPAARRLLVG